MAKLRVDKIAAPIVKDEFTGSVYFDGTGDYLSVGNASDADWAFGTDPFTVEHWIYWQSVGNGQLLSPGMGNETNAWYWQYYNSQLQWGAQGVASDLTYSFTPNANRWYHIAVSRDSANKMRFFIDGVEVASGTVTRNYVASASPLLIANGGAGYFTGYMSNVRVCKGHAVYDGNFTVPTRELEVHTGAKGVVFPAADNRTVLLACQDAYNPLTEATGRHKITGAGHLSGDFGKNIVTNGDFTDGTTGWTGVSGATLSVENGKLKITESTGAADGYAVNGTAITTVVGVTYKIEWTFTEGTNTSFQVRFGNSGDQSQEYQSNSAAGGTFNDGGTYSFQFTATGTQLNLSFIVNQASTYGYVSNVSVVAVAPISEANPGLLRKTNITSTITENTGAVYFDNSGDYLVPPVDDDELILGDTYSIEWWHYLSEIGTGDKRHGFIMAASAETTNTNESGGLAIYAENDGSQQRLRVRANNTGSDVTTPTGDILAGVWQHCAVQVNNNSCEIYIDGVLRASGNTNGSVTQRIRRIGSVYFVNSDYDTHGYISNLRICKGHVVYTSNFIPPTRELEAHTGSVDDRTVLLCCYDGENIFAEKTGRILRAVGDRTSSPTPTATDSPIGSTTVTPGLTREVDPVEGPTFGGGAGFTSQNWLTLPKGTTAERMPSFGGDQSGTRGFFAGGYSPTRSNVINYVTVPTLGNAIDFGNLGAANGGPTGFSDSTRGWIAGGNISPTITNVMEYVTMASSGNAVDGGDLITATGARPGSVANSIRGIVAGGSTPGQVKAIVHHTIQTTGIVQDFGDLTEVKSGVSGVMSPTRGVFAGGRQPGAVDTIEYVTIASTGNAVLFGELSLDDRGNMGGASNTVRGLFGGGRSPTDYTHIEYITMATLGDALDFGDLSQTGMDGDVGAVSNSTRVVFGGGGSDELGHVEIATLGNTTQFGKFTVNTTANQDPACFSSGHGGLG